MEKPERKTWQLLLLGGLALASYWLCVAGFLELYGPGWRNWTNALYHALRIWGFEYDGPRAPEEVPATLHIGRLGALLTVMIGTWLAAVALFRERLTPIRLLVRAPDVLFFGLTPHGLRIALAQKEALPGQRMALVARQLDDALVQRFRLEVSRLVLVGEPAAKHSVRVARIRRKTKLVYVAGETDAETLRIASTVLRQAGQQQARETPLRIVLLLKDAGVLQTFEEVLQNVDTALVELGWLDTTTLTARVLLQKLPPDSVRAPSRQRIHVLLFGSTPLIEALVVQLARNVYPREGLTRITVIASDIDRFRTGLFNRHPVLAPDFADRNLFEGLYPLVELDWLERLPASLSAEDIRRLEDAAPVTCAYVDGGQDSDTLATSQRLQQLRTRSLLEFPIAAWFNQEREVRNLEVAYSKDVFRYHRGERYLGERLDALAVLCNYAYMGDNKVPPLDASASEHDLAWAAASTKWAGLQEWARQSSRQVADHIPVKLRYLGLKLDTTSALTLSEAQELADELAARLPQLGDLEHRRFCAERMLDGWLPAPGSLWNPPGASKFELDATRKRLKGLRLNATLAVKVEKVEKEKDDRLAARIAWMLWLASQRFARVSGGS